MSTTRNFLLSILVIAVIGIFVATYANAQTPPAGQAQPAAPAAQEGAAQPSPAGAQPAAQQGTQNAANGQAEAAAPEGLKNPLNADSLQELLTVILRALVSIGSILLVLALVWVGFLFVFAQGQEEKIRDARNALMWTVVGGLLLLGAEAIALVIEATVGQL
ncbi:MAG: hypothetical protein WBK28_01870 [Minisyncoccia bacterium]